MLFDDSPFKLVIAEENPSGAECLYIKILSQIVFPICQPDTKGANFPALSTLYLVSVDKFGEQLKFSWSWL